ncbi:MAG: M23 family metallopeptidase [Gallionella sp.]|nr:M23 family metallopeptidase [Gallionella sp.]
MNIILVSNRLAKTHSISLGGKQILLALILLMVITVIFASALQNVLLRFAPQNLSDAARTILLSGREAERERQQAYVQASLQAMAAKVGQMQAQMQRLDALGGRLAKLTGMNPAEFSFDKPVAQGGPLVTSSVSEVGVADLERELKNMTQLVGDRGDKLSALQTMLMQNQLSQKLLPSVAPVKSGWYSSNFGWRVDPFTGQSAMHEGVDYVVPEGTPIYASAGGVVSYADKHPSYGNMVEIEHGNDIITRYAHASKLFVKVGQMVRRGDKIAEVGSTGRSTGNHLHFEVRYKGIAQNPVRFLKNAAS